MRKTQCTRRVRRPAPSRRRPPRIHPRICRRCTFVPTDTPRPRRPLDIRRRYTLRPHCKQRLCTPLQCRHHPGKCTSAGTGIHRMHTIPRTFPDNKPASAGTSRHRRSSHCNRYRARRRPPSDCPAQPMFCKSDSPSHRNPSRRVDKSQGPPVHRTAVPPRHTQCR